MSESVAILLDVDRVRVLSPSAPDIVRAEARWTPDAPDAAAAALRSIVPRGSNGVLVVGLGLLEIAQPDLPPLAPDHRRALLLRDADRYFPIADPVSVSWTDGFACAVSSAQLTAWVTAFESVCTLRGTTTVVECLARAAANGTWSLPVGPGETGRVVVTAGVIHDVRRGVIAAHAGAAGGRDVDLAAVARGAAAVMDAPLDAMLLDDGLSRRFARARRTRQAASVAALLLSVAALGWSADRWRARQLDAADARLSELTAAAEPALRADARVARARGERALLGAEDTAPPGTVLERLGALLPRDAFVQRLEWDGTVWRIEGSASSAPRIVPLLDADPQLSDVRIVAASTRFMDGGSQRESFSISFRAPPPGGPRVSR